MIARLAEHLASHGITEAITQRSGSMALHHEKYWRARMPKALKFLYG
ncbi:MAG: hypothetical protein U0V87_16580 [Acidobacteriota bacterium]